MNEKRNEAVSSLEVESVFFTNTLVNTYKEFDADLLPDDMYANGQTFQGLKRIQTFTDEDQPNICFYRFTYSIGLRFLSSEDKQKIVEQQIEPEHVEPYLEFKADFVVVYRSEAEIEGDSLIDFGNRYCRYHIWPYWREFVQSSCARLQIPTLSVPVCRV